MDLQTASLALKAARHTLSANPSAADVRDVINKATILANSQLVQGTVQQELLAFFGEASKKNAIEV